MTREEALEFLRQNTLTNMRLALLTDRDDKDYIRSLIDVVEGNTDEVRFPMILPGRLLIAHVQNRTWVVNKEFGLLITLRDAGGNTYWLRAHDSDDYFAVVESWGYCGTTI